MTDDYSEMGLSDRQRVSAKLVKRLLQESKHQQGILYTELLQARQFLYSISPMLLPRATFFCLELTIALINPLLGAPSPVPSPRPKYFS
jgi:hypothetical protein